MELKEKTVWFGEYRDIRFEINRFDSYDKYTNEFGWTYYLYFCAEQFPESIRQSLMPKVYYTAFGTSLETYRGPLDDLEWHGGMTWSSNETKSKSVFTSLKFGCDYQHLWDNYKSYTVESVTNDVHGCIDSLYRKFPEIIPMPKLWEEFRSKFPGEKAGDQRCFDKDGNAIPYPWDF